MRRALRKQLAAVILTVAMLISLTGIAENNSTNEDNFIILDEGSGEVSVVNPDGGLDLSIQDNQTDAIITLDLATADNSPAESGLTNNSATVKLGVDEKYKLDTSALGSGLTFKSKNAAVASVSKKGVVTAKKRGSTKITCTKGTTEVGSWTVQVLAAPKWVKLNKKTAALNVGKTLKLKATLPNKSASKLSWKSSDENIATVSDSGVVTAVGAGKATITVSTYNANKAQCVLMVSSLDEFVIESGVLVQYLGNGGDVIIPAKDKDGKSVKAIGARAFVNCEDLKSVTLPNTVVRIEDGDSPSDEAPYGAFSGCVNLTRVDLSDSLTWIGQYTFRGCTGLKQITIPKKVRVIPTGAFFGCTGLQKVSLPDNLTQIDYKAFYDCGSLTGIKFPGKLKTIDWDAFSYCASLKYVTIPKSVTLVGRYAFEECTALKAVKFLGSATRLGDNGVFWGCTSLKYVTLPDKLTELGDCLFRDCTSLKDVTIPKSVTNIGSAAFKDCTGLKSVTIPKSVTNIGWDAFSGCTSLKNVIVPNSVTNIDSGAFSGCTGLTSVTLSNKLTDLNDNLFWGCSSLKSVSIPKSVKEIHWGVFNSCASLTSVTVPEGVTFLGESAFGSCTRLKTVKLPASLVDIRNDAFWDCPKLTVLVKADSYAEQYCKDNDVPYRNY